MDSTLSSLLIAVPASASCYSTMNSLHSASSLDLPPIIDIRAHSSKHNILLPTSDDLLDKPPTFLEPLPVFNDLNYETIFRPNIYSSINQTQLSLSPTGSSLFSSSSSSSSFSSSLYSPLLKDASPLIPRHRCFSEASIISLDSDTSTNQAPQLINDNYPILKPNNRPNQASSIVADKREDTSTMNDLNAPLSPTMLAASASAAAATAAFSAIECKKPLDSSALHSRKTYNKKKRDGIDIRKGTRAADKRTIVTKTGTDRNSSHQGNSFKEIYSAVRGTKRSSSSVHQMFLTKNAHIKRPRNAWIHFRCHYGQALKFQDPTLRAEEISKRASHRWAKLSEKEKQPWHDLAQQEKQAHKEAFPDYRYCPRRSSVATAPSAAVRSQGEK